MARKIFKITEIIKKNDLIRNKLFLYFTTGETVLAFKSLH